MTELNSASRAILKELGTRDGPNANDRERVRRRLMTTLATTGALAGTSATLGAQAAPLVGAASTVATTGIATTKAVLTTQVAVWLVAGGVAGTLVSGGAALLQKPTAPAETAVAGSNVHPAPPPLVRAQVARAPAAVVEVQDAPADGAESTRVPQRATARRSVAESPTAAANTPMRPAEPNSESALSRELTMLKGAQRELAGGNAAASLAILDEHARVFPNGALSSERTAARAFALCALGRVSEARAIAQEFLRTAPSSPLVPRLLASCAGSNPGSASSP